MILHQFKIVINKRKKNFFLLFQLFISFIALFLFIGLNLKKFSNYFKPLGYNYSDIWVLDVNFQDTLDNSKKLEYSKIIKQKLQSIPEIEAISATTVVPFYQWGENVKLNYNNKITDILAFKTDEKYQEVLGIKMIEGRWFSAKDYSLQVIPAVITKDLADRDFNNEKPIGKTILIGEKKAVIIGISETFKENTSAEITPGVFIPMDAVPTKFIAKSSYTDNISILEEKIRENISSVGNNPDLIKKNLSLTMIKKYAHKLDYIQMSLALVLFFFLVINVFLGVSGVFTYNLSKRKAEVGLRVALGANSSDIFKQFIGETIALVTLGILPGLMIAIQLLIMQYFEPYMDTFNGILGIIVSAAFLYLLMIGCVFYPSMKIAKTQPANALHED